jgi:regulator of protease activity HflC (stomatin/prohibitin superfamily)
MKLLVPVAGVIAIVGGVILGWGYVSGLSKADGGTVIVVRNGGLFDDNSFQQVIHPNSSLTSTGLWSQNHPYPASQRFFKVSGTADADSNEVINVPTKDGVLVGIEGTFYFELSQDDKILEEFDNRFGTRTFAATVDGENVQLHAWDEGGWSPFLSATLGNLVQNVLREQIGQVRCSDLVASCALAQNATTSVTVDGETNTTLSTIQDAVNKSFSTEVEKVLGVAAFTNIQFALSKVTLPENVQNSINNAQSAVADAQGRVATAEASKAQAQAEAEANAKRQEGYNACPVCGEISKLEALPDGLTTYAPGGEFAVTGK